MDLELPSFALGVVVGVVLMGLAYLRGLEEEEVDKGYDATGDSTPVHPPAREYPDTHAPSGH